VAPTRAELARTLAVYRTASRGKTLEVALKAQRDLLAAADKGEVALQGDKSRPAESLLAVITGIRAGVAGDNNALDRAEAALGTPAGGPALAASSGATAATPGLGSDLSISMDTLSEKLRGFRTAVKDHNVDAAVRMQGDLLSSLTYAERAASADMSAEGKARQAALADVRKGIEAGDPDKLAVAAQSIGKFTTTTTAAEVDTGGMAASLMTKLDAFRTATSAKSPDDLLRLQRQILAEIDQNTTALALDESPKAKDLRAAMDATRGAISGDLQKIDGARATLGKIAGEQAVAQGDAPGQPAVGKAAPITDLSKFANDMAGTIVAFQAAIKKNDTASMLKLQRDLVDQTDRADTVLKTVPTKPAEAMRGAAATVRTAFAGDYSKLDEALGQLKLIGGTPGAPPAIGAASGAAGAAGAALANPANAVNPNVDLKPLTNELKNKLQTVREGAADTAKTAGQPRTAEELANYKADMDKRRAALQAEISKTEAAAKGMKLDDATAAAVREALVSLHEASAGDDSKLQDAAAKLDALTAPRH
jgi:hypothetical protein